MDRNLSLSYGRYPFHEVPSLQQLSPEPTHHVRYQLGIRMLSPKRVRAKRKEG